MNYFEDHIGDYAAATAHLSWDEDMAYTRLIRAYYHAEKPIPAAQAYRLARAATPAQRRAVDSILGEFFRLEDGAYRQKRCDEEIARFQDKQAKAKRSAEARWGGHKPQSGRNANASEKDMRTHSEGNALQSPDTKPISEPKGSGGKPPKLTDPKEIIFGYGLALLVNAGTPEKQARSFLGGLEKHHGPEALIDKLRECAKAKPLQPLEWLAAALPPGAAKKDIAAITVPAAANAGAALEKIKADDAKAAPIPESIRAQISDALKGKVH